MDRAPLFLIAPGPAADGLYVDVGTPGGPRGDSGTDLRFAEDVLIPPTASIQGLPVIVDLRVRARCLVGGEYAPFQIVPRSSISKTPLGLANSIGTIDAGYQGPLKIALRNYSADTWTCRRGDALFQLVRPDLAPALVSVVGEAHPAFAEATARGAGGFGSTGTAGAK
jgi:dUTP pyrophosphatase